MTGIGRMLDVNEYFYFRDDVQSYSFCSLGCMTLNHEAVSCTV